MFEQVRLNGVVEERLLIDTLYRSRRLPATTSRIDQRPTPPIGAVAF